MKLTDISKFEKQNPNIQTINVLTINEKNNVCTSRLSDQNCEKTIDLFFYKKGDNGYCSLIKNFNGLVDSQESKDMNLKNTFVKDVFNIIQNQNYFKNILNFALLIENQLFQ